MYDLDPKLIKSVIQVESNGNADAVGKLGEVGLMQVMPQYSYKRSELLFDPYHNVMEGARMLAFAKKHCKHQADNTFVVCYNLGVTAGNKVKHPKLFPYYKKVKGYMQ